MTVDFATANGTATAPADYQATAGTFTFTPGQTTRTVTVPVNGDLLDEANETSPSTSRTRRTRRSPTHRRSARSRTTTPRRRFRNDATAIEGDLGHRDATFTVSLNAPSGTRSPSTTRRRTAPRQPGRLHGAAADDAHVRRRRDHEMVTVLVNGDVLDEVDETYTLGLSNATNATIGDDLGLGTITDDDPRRRSRSTTSPSPRATRARSRRPSRSA